MLVVGQILVTLLLFGARNSAAVVRAANFATVISQGPRGATRHSLQRQRRGKALALQKKSSSSSDDNKYWLDYDDVYSYGYYWGYDDEDIAEAVEDDTESPTFAPTPWPDEEDKKGKGGKKGKDEDYEDPEGESDPEGETDPDEDDGSDGEGGLDGIGEGQIIEGAKEDTSAPTDTESSTSAPSSVPDISTSAPSTVPETSTSIPTVASTSAQSRTDFPTTGEPVLTEVPTNGPTVSVTTDVLTGDPTINPVVFTESPWISPTNLATEVPEQDTPSIAVAAEPEVPTVSPSLMQPLRTVEPTGKDHDHTGSPVSAGDDYYHRHLVPFSVSVEGDGVTNDLGMTNCLFVEMKKNMSNIFHVSISNFTLIEFDDEDGDGYDVYELYFAGFGEFLGMPLYSEDYFQSVQASILEDDVQFFQDCLDSRWNETGRTFTVQDTADDENDSIAAVSGNDNTVDRVQVEDENEQRLGLIIGLTVGGAIILCCVIIFAWKIMSGGK